MDFSETIVACDLKMGRCRQLIDEGMQGLKVRVSFDLDPVPHTYEN